MPNKNIKHTILAKAISRLEPPHSHSALECCGVDDPRELQNCRIGAGLRGPSATVVRYDCPICFDVSAAIIGPVDFVLFSNCQVRPTLPSTIAPYQGIRRYA